MPQTHSGSPLRLAGHLRVLVRLEGLQEKATEMGCPQCDAAARDPSNAAAMPLQSAPVTRSRGKQDLQEKQHASYYSLVHSHPLCTLGSQSVSQRPLNRLDAADAQHVGHDIKRVIIHAEIPERTVFWQKVLVLLTLLPLLLLVLRRRLPHIPAKHDAIGFHRVISTA
jgi:hypothetical protein